MGPDYPDYIRAGVLWQIPLKLCEGWDVSYSQVSMRHVKCIKFPILSEGWVDQRERSAREFFASSSGLSQAGEALTFCCRSAVRS
jgi:hypothetical protein